jgi:TonB family protein
MTRLQKKCLIAAVGTHLLVIVAVLCSGFIRPKPPVDNSTVLDVIPPNLVDAALNSGAKNAPTPPATIVPPTPPAPAPTPTPVVQPPPTPAPPPPPTPTPKPSILDQVVKMFKQETPPPDDAKPVETTEPKRQPHKIEISLTPVVHNVSKSTDTSAADQAREEKRLRDQRRKAVEAVARAIRDNASSATTVEDMKGDSSVSYANYASVVKSIYEKSWTAPDNTASDEAIVRVSVTISRDGEVVTSHILTPSGDSSVDDSVQRTLDRVTFIAPFPEGATEKERTFIINFNLKAKRMLG